MNLETVMSDVKSKFTVVQSTAQDLAGVSVDTFKQASGAVVGGVQVLVKTHSETANELFAAGKASFEKAKADGISAVVSNPMSYLPEGRERLTLVFNDTLTTFTKTGEDLAKILKSGYGTASAKIVGETSSKPKKAAAPRKTASKAKKTTAHKAASAKKAAAGATGTPAS